MGKRIDKVDEEEGTKEEDRTGGVEVGWGVGIENTVLLITEV